jgi:hypothetical protein
MKTFNQVSRISGLAFISALATSAVGCDKLSGKSSDSAPSATAPSATGPSAVATPAKASAAALATGTAAPARTATAVPAPGAALEFDAKYKFKYTISGLKVGYTADGQFGYCHEGKTDNAKITAGKPGCVVRALGAAPAHSAANAALSAGTGALPSGVAFALKLDSPLGQTDGMPTTTTTVQIGGALGSGAPAYIKKVQLETIEATGMNEDLAESGIVAAMVASDKSSVDFVIAKLKYNKYANGAAELSIERVPYARFFAQVGNETGMRSHTAKAYPEALVSFKRAAELDPTWELPHYNGACAAALAGEDETAKDLLEKAIKIGGAGVKGRAKKDADFAKVKSADWFKALTN